MAAPFLLSIPPVSKGVQINPRRAFLPFIPFPIGLHSPRKCPLFRKICSFLQILRALICDLPQPNEGGPPPPPKQAVYCRSIEFCINHHAGCPRNIRLPLFGRFSSLKALALRILRRDTTSCAGCPSGKTDFHKNFKTCHSPTALSALRYVPILPAFPVHLLVPPCK